MMLPTSEKRDDFPTVSLNGHPHLIFFTELEGESLYHLLLEQGVLHELTSHRYGLALAIRDLSEARARVVQHLNRHGVYTVAWLWLAPSEGRWFNLQNYPQAIDCYHSFRDWVQQHHLHFDAVGLDIRPPPGELLPLSQWSLRSIARRLWLARENVLYAPARSAYADLIAEIRHDHYEVHTYQLPLIADDRRAGTTLLQRALDVVDLPADVEVLLCSRGLALETPGDDLGGVLISSYGFSADSIGVGCMASACTHDGTGHALLSWDALKRDLLLSVQYTDTIYLSSLEGCVEYGLLPLIAQLDWESEAVQPVKYRVVFGVLRSGLLVALLLARYAGVLFAWMGWGLALFLLLRQRHHRQQTKGGSSDETLTHQS